MRIPLVSALVVAATLLLSPNPSSASAAEDSQETSGDLSSPNGWEMTITQEDGEVKILCMIGTGSRDVVGGQLTTVIRDCHIGAVLEGGTGQMRTTFTQGWKYETAVLADEREARARTDLTWESHLERTYGGGGFNSAWSADYFDVEEFGKSSALCHVPDDPFVTLVCTSTDELGPATTWEVALHRGFISVMSETPGIGWNVAWMRSNQSLNGIADLGTRGDLLGRPPWHNR